jgi:hypothetical protein
MTQWERAEDTQRLLRRHRWIRPGLVPPRCPTASSVLIGLSDAVDGRVESLSNARTVPSACRRRPFASMLMVSNKSVVLC